jgi:hypothetical protein
MSKMYFMQDSEANNLLFFIIFNVSLSINGFAVLYGNFIPMGKRLFHIRL